MEDAFNRFFSQEMLDAISLDTRQVAEFLHESSVELFADEPFQNGVLVARKDGKILVLATYIQDEQRQVRIIS